MAVSGDDMSVTDPTLTDAAQPPSESIDRLPGPDVVRAVALIGVVVMNYHGYLMFRAGGYVPPDTVAEEIFDPFTGPLATRFAATFVLTAGVGITLLTRRAVAERAAGVVGAERAITEMRWRLVRRGLALYVLGLVLDTIWPGTIIVYYGAMFVLAAMMFTLASRWLFAIGVGSALAGWWIETWSFWRVEDGGSVAWLTDPGSGSVRGYVFDVAINGTHPLLPWMAFLCAGIIVGRVLELPDWRWWCGGIGLLLFAASTLLADSANSAFTEVVLSNDPFDRGVVYVASALGTALVAFAAISWVADNATGVGMRIIDPLRRAGQMSLTIYIAHILVFNLLVDWLGWIEPGGLGSALSFACAFWIVAIAAAAVWQRRVGRGPAERVYRAIGG